MDSPNINPPINIIMSFDPLIIDLIRKSNDLEAFELAAKPYAGINIFRQSPTEGSHLAADFLSLSHEFGFGAGGSEGKTTRLELEFLDPDSNFEVRLTGDLNDYMWDKSSLRTSFLNKIRSQLQVIREEVLERTERLKSWSHWAMKPGQWNRIKGSKAYEKRAEEEYATLVRRLREELKMSAAAELDKSMQLGEFQATLDSIGGEQLLRQYELLLQQQSNQGFMMRPVWVTYGVGTNFNDWSPVMVFEKAMDAKYEFTGDGVRKLRVIYDGQSVTPYFNPIGKFGLGNLGMNLIIKGQSKRLFHMDTHDMQMEGLRIKLDRVDNYLTELSQNEAAHVDVYNPSIHKIITEIYKSYIKAGTSYKNVVVAFPDLDKLLQNFKILNASRTVNQIGYNINRLKRIPKYGTILADMAQSSAVYSELLELFGFKLVESDKEGFQAPVDLTPAAAEQITDSAEIINFYDKKVIRGVLSTNTSTDMIQENILLAPLKRSTDKLTEAVRNSNKGLAFDVQFTVENDSDILNAMHKSGLIEDPSYPAIIFGDRYFIHQYLYGQQILESEYEDDTALNKIMDSNYLGQVSVWDKVEGINYVYMKLLRDIFYPAPWRTPFGAAGMAKGERLELANDTNVDITSLEKLQDESPHKTLRMPIFTLGTKNTNILSIDFNIKESWFGFINSMNYQTITAAQVMGAILPTGKLNACMGLLDRLRELDLNEKPEPPQGFIEIIKPWFVINNYRMPGKDHLYLPYNELSPESAGERATWAKVFRAFGIKEGEIPSLIQMDRRADPNWDSEMSVEKMLAFGRYQKNKQYKLAKKGWTENQRSFLGNLFESALGSVNPGWAKTYGEHWRGREFTTEEYRESFEMNWERYDLYDKKEILDKKISEYDKWKRNYIQKASKSIEDHNTALVMYYWERFQALLIRVPKPVQEVANADAAGILNRVNTLVDAMTTAGFTGSMKTLPMFHLSTAHRVSSRDALLYAVEPKLFGYGSNSEVALSRKWFSGMYVLIGYKHTISTTDAYSEFSFARTPSRGVKIT